MTHLKANPNGLRTLATLLAMPEADAIDALRDMHDQAPWLESSLPELEQLPLEHWQAEYTRLFITAYPKIPCPPYGSAYRQGTMGGTVARELVQLYRRAGLQPTDIPSDYLGTMLECAAYLQDQGMEALLEELVDGHMKPWVPRFARDLQNQTRLDLYRVLGKQIENLFPETSDAE